MQFGVLYEHRASDHLKRMEVIDTVVDCISQVRSIATGDARSKLSFSLPENIAAQLCLATPASMLSGVHVLSHTSAID